MSTDVFTTKMPPPVPVRPVPLFQQVTGEDRRTKEKVTVVCAPVESWMPREYADEHDPFRAAINEWEGMDTLVEYYTTKLNLDVTDCNHLPKTIHGRRGELHWVAILWEVQTIRHQHSSRPFRMIATYSVDPDDLMALADQDTR